MARAARDAGFDVHIATRVQNGAAAISAERFALHAIPFERGRLSPGAGLRTVRALRRLHRQLEPAIVHHVSLQPTIFGSAASLGRNVACVNAITGLGFAFTSTTLRARAVRPAIAGLLRLLLNRDRVVALVQNPDDHQVLKRLGIAEQRIVRIAGSGIDLDAFTPAPEPSGTFTLGFVGRLLEDKGIRVLVEAFRLLRRRGVMLELRIAGDRDPANPSSIGEAELNSWKREGVILEGHIDDIAGFWRRTHVAVLPSRREGLPKSLLEAAASGRPMIATDVPGCREVVRHDATGLLVPVDDPAALAVAISTLASSPDLRARYGAMAREDAELRFGNTQIAREIVALYKTLLTS